jgi:HEAT repeat protein
MGSYEEREQYLKAQFTEGRFKGIIEGTKALPKAFKLFFAHHLRYENHYERQGERQGLIRDCCTEWKKLKPAKRKALVSTLFPRIAEDVLAGIAVAGRAAYQSGYRRRPFRCPQSGTQIATMECEWMIEAATVWGDYDQDAAWLAKHSSFFSWSTTGPLIAGVLDRAGPKAAELLDLFGEIAAGEHEYATLDYSILKGCLSSASPEGWGFATRLLLAAQRQEGLRQTILESVDEAHPGAFDAMLTVIREENLGRFSSVVRAVDVWFGFLWDQETKFKVDPTLARVQPLLLDDSARMGALESEDAETVYLGLWATAFHDIDLAVERAEQVLEREDPEHRYAALHLLQQSQWTGSREPIIRALSDPDLRIALNAVTALQQEEAPKKRDEVFDAVEALLGRLDPKKKTVKLDAAIWPWTGREFERSQVILQLMRFASAERMLRLIPLIPDLAPYERERAMERLANMSSRWERPERGPDRLESPTYDLALLLLGDPSADVRSTALRALSKTPLLKEEADRHVELLRRKSSDVRTNALVRLSTLPDASLVEIAERLMGDGVKERRVAGLELAREAVTSDRCVDAMGTLATAYVERRKSLSDVEESHLQVLRGSAEKEITLDDAMGLIDPAALMVWERPSAPKLPKPPKELPRLLNELCGVVIARSEEERRRSAEDPEGAETVMGAVPYALPGDPSREEEAAYIEANWKPWYEEHCAKLKDGGGLVWLHAYISHVNYEKIGSHGKAVSKSRDRWNQNPTLDSIERLIPWMIV